MAFQFPEISSSTTHSFISIILLSNSVINNHIYLLKKTPPTTAIISTKKAKVATIIIMVWCDECLLFDGSRVDETSLLLTVENCSEVPKLDSVSNVSVGFVVSSNLSASGDVSVGNS